MNHELTADETFGCEELGRHAPRTNHTWAECPVED